MTTESELPKYKSHKTVWALKLKDVRNGWLYPADGQAFDKFQPDHPTWHARFAPKADAKGDIDCGYYVKYADGYESWSPTEAFEEGYDAIIPSTSDDRTVNNVMRHEYRTLTDGEKALMLQLKDMGRDFVELCDEIGGSRELSLAKTKAEEAVMWAVKHVTG